MRVGEPFHDPASCSGRFDNRFPVNADFDGAGSSTRCSIGTRLLGCVPQDVPITFIRIWLHYGMVI